MLESRILSAYTGGGSTWSPCNNCRRTAPIIIPAINAPALKAAESYPCEGNNIVDSSTAFCYGLGVRDAMNEPKSLQEAIIYFSNPDNCVAYITARRWRSGVTCPGCGSDKVKFNPKRHTWQCSTHHAKR